ncbi:MAG: ricin-type beta-trefoil lectin domain protein [Cellvibrionaceae bacterium]|nr:ricin-type beta-trefoil lectin domain protein [Cellvibrionaceae bacterium]
MFKLSHKIVISFFMLACVSDQLFANTIGIFDKAPGWASMNGSTTGGGTDLSGAVSVTSMSELTRAISGSSSKIVLVEPGTYNGTLSPGANTTIIGTAPGVTIFGNISISGSDKKNIIIRNIAVRGERCGSYDECKDGDDAVYIGNNASNIWFDHVDIADGQDGNFDVTRAGDFVTCSWCKFHYTYDKEHRFSNLIAGGDGETQSRGKLRITFMNSWWGDRVGSRQPRGRFGKIHMLNNYHANGGDLHGVGFEMSLIAENNYYDVPGKNTFFSMGSPTGWQGSGNKGTARNLNDSFGQTFSIPYSYSKMSADQAKAVVTSSSCGAGNTCNFDFDGNSPSNPPNDDDSGGAQGYSSLKNAHSDKCLRISNSSYADNAAVVQETCQNGWASQQFSLNDTGDSFFLIKNRLTDKCLRAAGSQVVQYTCDNSYWSEKFSRESVGSNAYLYKNLYNGQCLRIENSSSADGTAIVFDSCDAGFYSQRFIQVSQ